MIYYSEKTGVVVLDADDHLIFSDGESERIIPTRPPIPDQDDVRYITEIISEEPNIVSWIPAHFIGKIFINIFQADPKTFRIVGDHIEKKRNAGAQIIMPGSQNMILAFVNEPKTVRRFLKNLRYPMDMSIIVEKQPWVMVDCHIEFEDRFRFDPISARAAMCGIWNGGKGYLFPTGICFSQDSKIHIDPTRPDIPIGLQQEYDHFTSITLSGGDMPDFGCLRLHDGKTPPTIDIVERFPESIEVCHIDMGRLDRETLKAVINKSPMNIQLIENPDREMKDIVLESRMAPAAIPVMTDNEIREAVGRLYMVDLQSVNDRTRLEQAFRLLHMMDAGYITFPEEHDHFSQITDFDIERILEQADITQDHTTMTILKTAILDPAGFPDMMTIYPNISIPKPLKRAIWACLDVKRIAKTLLDKTVIDGDNLGLFRTIHPKTLMERGLFHDVRLMKTLYLLRPEELNHDTIDVLVRIATDHKKPKGIDYDVWMNLKPDIAPLILSILGNDPVSWEKWTEEYPRLVFFAPKMTDAMFKHARNDRYVRKYARFIQARREKMKK